VDHQKRFIDLTVGWPGSVADGRVWANSALKAKLKTLLQSLPSIPVATRATDTSPMQQEFIPPFIMADSAYGSTARMVPTFKNTECARCPLTKQLNARLSGIRYCIENAFGICKGRFRLLNRPLECAKEDVTRATRLITAIFILHNFLIDENDETRVQPVYDEDSSEDEDEDEDKDEVVDNEDELTETRHILMRHMRWINKK
jgi:DDE superfamily endonuclease